MTLWMSDGAGSKFKASVQEFLFDRGFFLSTNHKMIHASSRHPVGNSQRARQGVEAAWKDDDGCGEFGRLYGSIGLIQGFYYILDSICSFL